MKQSGIFYLSEKGGEDKGELFRKRILYEGRFVHPNDPKKWLDITKDHMRDAIRNFKQDSMDKVQMYFTHNEDPRNLAGTVVGLDEGIDPSDGKVSLYATLKADSPAATLMMKNNAVGVSAGLDHWYREHATGRDLGMTVKHVALVGEGYIKKLGEFLPIPGSKQLATNMSELAEHGAIYFAEKTEEDDDSKEIKLDDVIKAHLALDDGCGTEVLLAQLDAAGRKGLSDSQFAYVEPNCPAGDNSCRHFPIHDEAHVRNALTRLSQSKWGDKASAKVHAAAKKYGIKTEGEKVNNDDKDKEKGVDKEELIAEAKKQGFSLLTETEKAKLDNAVNVVGALRKGLNLSENDDVAKKIVEDYQARDDQIKTEKATAAVVKLIEAKRLLPAQKDAFVSLYKMDQKHFDAITATLKPGVVPLGEKGREEDHDAPSGDENDPGKISEQIQAALALADSMKIPLNDDGKAIVSSMKKS